MKNVVAILWITIGSFLLGFFRDLLIAREYGGGVSSDILFVSLSIPVFFENVLGVALRDAIIPFFKRIQTDWPQYLRAAEWRIGGMLLFISIFITGIFGCSPEVWLKMLIPGWEGSLISSARIPFQVGILFIPVLVWSYFLTGILNARGNLILPTARSVFLNSGALIMLLCAKNETLWILIGMLSGLMLHMFWMQANSNRTSIKRERVVKLPSHVKIGIGAAIVPLLVSTVALQVNIIAERFFASWLPEGSISHLSYAFRLTTIPHVLFSFSFVTVLFPALISTHLALDRAAFSRLTVNGVKVTCVVMIPSALFLILCANPLVEVLLQRGEFLSDDTVATASAIRGYSLGLPAMALSFMGTRILVAMGRSKVLIPVSIVAMVATVGFCYFFVANFGIQGLAIGASVGAVIQCLYLWFCICRYGKISIGWKFGLRCIIGSITTILLLRYHLDVQSPFRILVGALESVGCFLTVLWITGERRLISKTIVRFREEML